jgi:hypothetical protein
VFRLCSSEEVVCNIVETVEDCAGFPIQDGSATSIYADGTNGESSGSSGGGIINVATGDDSIYETLEARGISHDDYHDPYQASCVPFDPQMEGVESCAPFIPAGSPGRTTTIFSTPSFDVHFVIVLNFSLA